MASYNNKLQYKCLQTSIYTIYYNNIVYNQVMSHKEKNIEIKLGSQINAKHIHDQYVQNGAYYLFQSI